MKKAVVIILGVVVVAAVAIAALTVFRTPEDASAPIEAVPLVVETSAPTAVAVAPAETTPDQTTDPTATPVVEPTATKEEPTAVAEAEPTATDTAEPVEEPTEEPAPEVTINPVVFEIVPAESQARFVINEVLRGSPKTVVGATDQVAGQLAVHPDDPTAAQVGTILVNARTLATDSSMRDRALKNFILETNSYEYVSFEPTELLGIPDNVAVGEPFSFQIAGNLTVKDHTVPVTFDVTITPVSETRLEGLASMTVPYRDLNVSIPDSPSVDTVDDNLTLELEFVAVPAAEA